MHPVLFICPQSLVTSGKQKAADVPSVDPRQANKKGRRIANKAFGL
jgi:hypothetical protein